MRHLLSPTLPRARCGSQRRSPYTPLATAGVRRPALLSPVVPDARVRLLPLFPTTPPFIALAW